MSEEKRYYLVLAVREWKGAFECANMPFPATVDGPGIGFCSVFDDLIAATEYADGKAQVVEIRTHRQRTDSADPVSGG